MNNWFCGEKKDTFPLPTTAFQSLHILMILQPNEAVFAVCYLLREKMGHYSQVSLQLPRLGTYLSIAGTAECQEELGDMAGGASCLRVVLQSLGDDPYKQEDLQSLQGLVVQKEEVYPVPLKPPFLPSAPQPFGTLVVLRAG